MTILLKCGTYLPQVLKFIYVARDYLFRHDNNKLDWEMMTSKRQKSLEKSLQQEEEGFAHRTTATTNYPTGVFNHQQIHLHTK